MLDAKPILSVLFFSKELPELRVQIIGYLLKSQIKSNFVTHTSYGHDHLLRISIILIIGKYLNNGNK